MNDQRQPPLSPDLDVCMMRNNVGLRFDPLDNLGSHSRLTGARGGAKV